MTPRPRTPEGDTLILAIETSCDETAAAVLRGEDRVLSDIVASQVDLHSEYGGVVPELACRAHLESIVPVVERALAEAGVGLGDIHALAVTQGPGLMGALLVGLSFAKSLAWSRGLPLVPVHHLEAHLSAAFLEGGAEVPFVGLVASGGHTALYRCSQRGEYALLGQTLDDAAGEAFDKVAKMLGLGYPGGIRIDRLAREGDPKRYAFPRPMLRSDTLDFSFSGLKTAIRAHCEHHPAMGDRDLRDTCASFQEAVVDTLVQKTLRAAAGVASRAVVACGGVACNTRLRARLEEEAARHGFSLCIPRPRYCTDNAAMVASAGRHRFLLGVRAGLEIDAIPTWPLSAEP